MFFSLHAGSKGCSRVWLATGGSFLRAVTRAAPAKQQTFSFEMAKYWSRNYLLILYCIVGHQRMEMEQMILFLVLLVGAGHTSYAALA